MVNVQICYRVADSEQYGNKIYDALAETFDYVTRQTEVEIASNTNTFKLNRGDTLIVVIGSNWLNLRDEQNVRLIDKPDDFVARTLLNAFLKSDVLVITALMDGAELPHPRDLPSGLQKLSTCRSIAIGSEQFDNDVNRLRQAVWVRVAPKKKRPLFVYAGIALFLILALGVAPRVLPIRQIIDEASFFIERLDTQLPAQYTSEGWDHYLTGDYEQAIENFAHALRLDPDLSEAYGGLGWSHLRLNNTEEALTNFNRVIEIAPQAANSFADRGWFYYSVGSYDLAIADFEKSVELAPPGADLYIGLGWSNFYESRYEAAIEAFDEALQIDPDLAEAYYAKGQSYDALSNTQQALENYERYLELEPNPDPAAIQRIEELKPAQ